MKGTDRILVITSCENMTEGRHFGLQYLTEAIDMKLYRKIINNKMSTFKVG